MQTSSCLKLDEVHTPLIVWNLKLPDGSLSKSTRLNPCASTTGAAHPHFCIIVSKSNKWAQQTKAAQQPRFCSQQVQLKQFTLVQAAIVTQNCNKTVTDLNIIHFFTFTIFKSILADLRSLSLPNTINSAFYFYLDGDYYSVSPSTPHPLVHPQPNSFLSHWLNQTLIRPF